MTCILMYFDALKPNSDIQIALHITIFYRWKITRFLNIFRLTYSLVFNI